MFRRISNVGHPITAADLLSAFLGIFDKKCCEKFAQSLRTFTQARHVFLLNSGTASFYAILEVLKKFSRRQEVILPAYTASSLILAIRKAGLKPVLCDISMEDFNADLDDMLAKAGEKTLCVVPVHMFGIPWAGIVELRKRLNRDIYVVEDCAQAFGARIEGRSVGIFGDAAFFSFNRGKNLPTVTGGCIATDSDELARGLEEGLKEVPSPSAAALCATALKLKGLCLAYKPLFYRIFYPLIARFKENSIPKEFKTEKYTQLQAAFGESLLRRAQGSFEKRLRNGQRIIEALRDKEGVLVPHVSDGAEPVFNRLPVVFRNKEDLQEVERRLGRKGIETSRFYLKPLHHLFDLGYKKEEFPNASYLAGRLLTLPVHPLVTPGDLEAMIKAIREAGDT